MAGKALAARETQLAADLCPELRVDSPVPQFAILPGDDRTDVLDPVYCVFCTGVVGAEPHKRCWGCDVHAHQRCYDKRKK